MHNQCNLAMDLRRVAEMVNEVAFHISGLNNWTDNGTVSEQWC